LAETDDVVWTYAYRFLRESIARWKQDLASHSTEDEWYILARAIGKAKLDDFAKLTLLFAGLTEGNASVREATVHAIGDMGGILARGLLTGFEDSDPMVNDAIKSVLEDLAPGL